MAEDPAEVTVIESGYTFRRANTADCKSTFRQLPVLLVRYGINDHIELRARDFGYFMLDEKDAVSGLHYNQFGNQDLQFGFTLEVLQQKNWRPMVTVVSGIFVLGGTRGISAFAFYF